MDRSRGLMIVDRSSWINDRGLVSGVARRRQEEGNSPSPFWRGGEDTVCKNNLAGVASLGQFQLVGVASVP